MRIEFQKLVNSHTELSHREYSIWLRRYFRRFLGILVPSDVALILFIYYWMTNLPQSDPLLLALVTLLFSAPVGGMMICYRRRVNLEKQKWEKGQDSR